MSRKETVDFYLKVNQDYDTGCYTQEQLAEKHKCSTDIIAFCTKKYGYCHTKAPKGKKIFTFEDDKDLDELEKKMKNNKKID